MAFTADLTIPSEEEFIIASRNSTPLGNRISSLIKVVSVIETLLKAPVTRKYINLFNPVWSSKIVGNLPEDKLFLISKEYIELEDGSSMYDYTSIEEEEVAIESVGVSQDLSLRTFSISYGTKETERLLSLYANAVPQLQVALDEDPLGATATTTNSVKGDGLTFNSLSSLGPISQETLTLNVVSDLEGQIIEQREAVVTDVGGVTTTAARRNVGASERIEREATSAGLESGNVSITSGY